MDQSSLAVSVGTAMIVLDRTRRSADLDLSLRIAKSMAWVQLVASDTTGTSSSVSCVSLGELGFKAASQSWGAQQVRALAALANDSTVGPSTHMGGPICIPVRRAFGCPLLTFEGTSTRVAHIHPSKILIHTIK